MEAICCCKELLAIVPENSEMKTTIKPRSNFEGLNAKGKATGRIYRQKLNKLEENTCLNVH